jgi:hypothetical protein
MKVRQIAIDFFCERERQMSSNYFAMFVIFAHLAIKERQIASIFFSGRERQVTTAIRYDQTNYSKRGYFVHVLSHTWDI